jgi:hypothetical protein
MLYVVQTTGRPDMTRIWVGYYIGGKIVGSTGPRLAINPCWRQAVAEKTTFDRIIPNIHTNLLVACGFRVDRPQTE